MQYKVKVTVIDKKLYPELQAAYCADPQSGACPCYNVGDTFVFERYGLTDDFWHMGLNTLKKTSYTADGVAGGPAMPHCSEAWDAIARDIYTGLQGGSIMRGWMRDEHQMIACCSDGTRPVIFRIERLDYKLVHVADGAAFQALVERFASIPGVHDVQVREDLQALEVYMDRNEEVPDATLRQAAEERVITAIE